MTALELLIEQRDAHVKALSEMRGITATSPLMQQLMQLEETIALSQIAASLELTAASAEHLVAKVHALTDQLAPIGKALERIDDGLAGHVEQSVAEIAGALETLNAEGLAVRGKVSTLKVST
jgi:hypothetical protein